MPEAVGRDAVVDLLLEVEPGDQLALECASHAWKAPFDVEDVDEIEWQTPTGSSWRSRTVEVNPTNHGKRRTLDVYEGGPAPVPDPAYGPLAYAAVIDRDCPWLERPADEIVETKPNLSRDLSEVLEAVETGETVIDVRQRLGYSLTGTKNLLWELGLRHPEIETKLLEEPERSERIDALREVFVDA